MEVEPETEQGEGQERGAVFGAALRQMDLSGSATFGPTAFVRYLRENGLPAKRTWQYVSVDSIDRLSPELRAASTMVFRLGARTGQTGTYFALARCENDWRDYFLLDNDLLALATPEVYLPDVPVRSLFAFQLLPKLTETSLVNLAVGSGLLRHVLGVEERADQVVPATGQSTFTFPVAPRPGVSAIWEHRNGQVEIDALFLGRRGGKETLFIVEAKCGLPKGSIAKHKLVYPFAALRATVPDYIGIVPVYVKTWAERDGQHFLVTEREPSLSAPVVVSELRPLKVSLMVLNGYGSA